MTRGPSENPPDAQREFQLAVEAAVPERATVLVISRGDPQLLKFRSRRGWHFPQRDDGAYAGHYPADSDEAIAHLEALRRKGAEFLAVPVSSFWWLEHPLYAPWREHLNRRYLSLPGKRSAAIIFDLRTSRATAAVGDAPVVPADIDLIAGSALFDLQYYRRQSGGQFTGRDQAVRHYLSSGWRQGLDPHPLFDAGYYSGQEPALPADAEPLTHYLRSDRLRGPNPLFDPAYCRCSFEDFINNDTTDAPYPCALVEQVIVRSGLKPSPRPLLWLAIHEASRTGAPLIGLNILQRLVRKHDCDCAVILGRGGALETELQAVAPVLNLEHIWQVADRPSAVRMLLFTAGRGREVRGICNSIETRQAMDAMHGLSVPFVSLIHEFPEYCPDAVVQTVVAQSERIVFPATIVQQGYVEHCGASHKMTILPQGLYDPEFPRGDRDAARRQLREELGLPPDTFVCLGCGYVDMRKGADHFIAIARALLARHADAPLVFVWVGDPNAVKVINSFQFWLMEDLKIAGLADKVRFIGPRNPADSYFLGADAFLMVSRQDPFPSVVLEALAATLPVVCYDSRIGSTEVLRRAGGIVVPFLDVNAAADAIWRLYEDPVSRRRIGEQGRELVRREFQFDQYVNRLVELIEPLALPHDLDLTPVARRPLQLSDSATAIASALPIAPCACKAEAPPKVSIVIVTYNGLLFTRLCLNSVLANTSGPRYEIIIVDNASSDGTRQYLAELPARHSHVRTIANDTNRGFAAANNQGLAEARGDVLVLLNNDTLVTPGWLDRLCAILEDRTIGCVGPVTNRIGNEAEIDTSYRTYGQMLDFAREYTQAHAGEMTDIPTLCMYCLAMRRETFKRIGPIDERFTIGMLEDDDYAQRMHQASLRVVCAEDVFVHHFGSASFGGLVPSGEYGRLLEKNKRLFAEKWGREWQPYARRPKPGYDQLSEGLRRVVEAFLPVDGTVLVISKGDENLLRAVEADRRKGWHFPRSSSGAYAGCYPADSEAAIAQLEEQRRGGAGYLIIPATSLWWLDHYAGFREHLETRYAMLLRDEQFGIAYSLAESAAPSEAPKSAAEAAS